MLYALKVLPIASDDITCIVSYYDDETGNTKIGNKLVLSIDSKLNDLKKNYTKYQVRYRNVRLAHLKKFSYSIHYIIDNELKRIVVIAVFSMKEDPEKWEKRHANINHL